MPKTAIVCFRNDFRLEDNPALQEAILSGMEILPVFIYDELTWGEFGLGGVLLSGGSTSRLKIFKNSFKIWVVFLF